MNTKFLQSASLVMILLFLMTGCGATGRNASEERAQAAQAGDFQIVTSFYPIYIATINIAGNIPGVDVKNMTKPQTGCLHDYALKPEDLKTLETADVFVVNGAGMEAFLDDVIRQQQGLKLVEASNGISLLRDDNGEDNPHVWLSITNEVRQVENIAAGLSEADPAHADIYKKNALDYEKKLEVLKQEMHEVLDPLKARDIITFHEAFPYFAQEFNLRIAAVIEREPGTEPTPKELGDIIDLVRESGVKALFAEPQYSSRAAEAIARETGAVIRSLDPIVTGDAEADARDGYIRAMELNKDALLEALGGDQ